MKQTAVQWLFEKLPTIDKYDPYYADIIQQAKEIEKQQIMKAVFDSMGTNLDPNIGRAELYYNETYKNTKE
jgi:hypothetical protein